jgi:predicted MFS family arabinose efflux permease
VFFDVADQSFLPAVVRREDLVEGNSKLGSSDSLAEIAGPSLGGILVQVISAPLAILLDALSFLASAAFLGAIRAVEPPPRPVDQRQQVWQEMAEGLRVVLRHPMLRALAGNAATHVFFGNFIGTLYTIYLINDLKLPPAAVGISIGAGGVGALLGALVAPRLIRRLGLGPVLSGTLLVNGTVGLLLVVAGGPWPLALGIIMFTQLVGDIGWAVFFIGEVSLRQALIPGHLLGRANATMQFLVGALVPVSALLAGGLGEAIGTRPVIFVGIVGVMASELWIIFSPIRHLRETPAPEQPADPASEAAPA